MRKGIDGKTIFDQDAAQYDRARPSYPERLIEDVIAYAGLKPDARILEVGCGTGKATLPFAQTGYAMLCIEPGPNMAAIAADKCREYPQVEFCVSAFEDWPVEKASFDLVIAAACFQWLPREIALPNMAAALKPNGAIALFWNKQPRCYTGVQQEFNEAYRCYAPHLAWCDAGDGEKQLDEAIRAQLAQLEDSGLFRDITVKRYPWSRELTAEQYVDLANTYSDYRSLSDGVKRRLGHALSDVVERHGGTITKDYVGLLYLART